MVAPTSAPAVLEHEHVADVVARSEGGGALGPEVDHPPRPVAAERPERGVVVGRVQHHLAPGVRHGGPPVREPAHVVGVGRLEAADAERAAGGGLVGPALAIADHQHRRAAERRRRARRRRRRWRPRRSSPARPSRSSAAIPLMRWSTSTAVVAPVSRRPTSRPRRITAIRVLSANTWSKLWLTITMVRPRCARSAMRSCTRDCSWRPRAAMGSSMRRISDPQCTARAMATPWRWPPDSLRTS